LFDQDLHTSFKIRKKIGLFLGIPLAAGFCLLPTPEGMSVEAQRIGGISILMAFWWITEAIPIPATALLPIVLFPLLGIHDAQTTASAYGDRNIFLFMGGFFIALAMAKWKLHRRIALYIIWIIGTSKRRLVLGFMVSSAFLSLWISNTATALMMLPISTAVILSLKEMKNTNLKESTNSFPVALMLGICYGASIGGIGTLVGTPPNIIFSSISQSLFQDAPEFGFGNWLFIGLPVTIIFLPICWFYLTFIVFRIKRQKTIDQKEVITKKIDELGSMTIGEKMVLAIFCFTALGWIFRADLTIGNFHIPGWSNLFPWKELIHDSTVAIFASILLFLIPVSISKPRFLLSWEDAKNIPWGILILFGGGIALAEGFKSTGLSEWIGHNITFVQHISPFFTIIVVCLTITFMTEITSNTATANIFLPVLASIAVSFHIHPYLLMIPATISASCAFMLPVATPPNAIIFSSGYVSMSDMVKAGFVLNFLGALLIPVIIYFISLPLLGIDSSIFPSWAY